LQNGFRENCRQWGSYPRSAPANAHVAGKVLRFTQKIIFPLREPGCWRSLRHASSSFHVIFCTVFGILFRFFFSGAGQQAPGARKYIRCQSLLGHALELRGAGCAAPGVRAQGLCLRLAPMPRRAVCSYRAPDRRVGQRRPKRCAPRSWSNCGSPTRTPGWHCPSELA
jgi:hypothetical protein